MLTMRYGTIGDKPGGAAGGSGGGAKIAKLWTNPAPASTFAAQTVALDLSGYDAIEVVFKASTSSDTSVKWLANKDGMAYNAFNFSNITTSSVMTMERRSITATDAGVAFSANTHKTLNATTGSTSNTYLIPYEIYGVVFG